MRRQVGVIEEAEIIGEGRLQSRISLLNIQRVADKYDALVLSIVWANRGFDFYRTIPETAYAVAYLDEFRQTDADPDTGCMEFELCKGRFAFRLTAPYSEERKQAASALAKRNTKNLRRGTK